MRRNRDTETKLLFEKPRIEKLAPGFSYNERGEIVDAKGNVYGADSPDPIKEARSEGLQSAQRVDPDIKDDTALSELARIDQRDIDAARRKRKSKRS